MNSRLMRWYGLPILLLAALLFMMLTPQPVFAAATYTGGSGDGFTLLSSSTMRLDGTTPTWESYKEVTHDNVWGTVANHYTSSFNTAYMYGGNFTATHTYSVGFYDNDGDKAATDSGVLSDSNLSAQYVLNSDPARPAGTWNAVAFDIGGSPPTTYAACSGAAGYVVEDDFIVDTDAIPEFPTVFAAIGVAGLCFGVYYWMRRRRLAYVRV